MNSKYTCDDVKNITRDDNNIRLQFCMCMDSKHRGVVVLSVPGAAITIT